MRSRSPSGCSRSPGRTAEIQPADMSTAPVEPGISRQPSAVEREVHRLWELARDRRYAEVLPAAQPLAEQVPENRDVLYLIAQSQRYLNRIADSLATLERLEQHHPRFSRLFQE